MKSKLSLPLAAAGCGLFLASSASAQVMTEIRISTAGVDEEYVEIQGIPGASTDGLMLVVVEADLVGASGGYGTVDFVTNLSGNTIPSNGLFVLGSSQASSNLIFGSEIDVVLGNNLFENSSLTMYLISAPDPSDQLLVQSWDNTDITNPIGSTTTLLAQTPGVTILDAVGIWDGDVGDTFLDGAPVFGPDGPFLPAGIFRPGGCPNDWCSDIFLTFQVNGQPNPPYADPTPGSVNPGATCTPLASVGSCPGGGTGVGTPYCQVNPNSSGAAAVLTGSGSAVAVDNNLTLVASNLPPNQFGFFINSNVTGFVANIGTNGSGNLCLGGGIGRFNLPSQILNAGPTGEFSLAVDLVNFPRPATVVSVMAGETWFFQAWFRDIVNFQQSSNLTNGLEVNFQ